MAWPLHCYWTILHLHYEQSFMQVVAFLYPSYILDYFLKIYLWPSSEPTSLLSVTLHSSKPVGSDDDLWHVALHFNWYVKFDLVILKKKLKIKCEKLTHKPGSNFNQKSWLVHIYLLYCFYVSSALRINGPLRST